MAPPLDQDDQPHPRTTRELLRLPPRSIARPQPAAINHPIKGQHAFGNIVTAVYAAFLRELRTKKDQARFRKTERGKFGLA
jgi:hypothetical protein